MSPPLVKYLSPLTSTLIIRCPRAHYRLVWAALSSLTSLPIPSDMSAMLTPQREKHSRSSSSTRALHCVFQVVRVSGTIRKAEEEAIRRARAEIRCARRLEGDGGGLGGLDEWFGREKKDNLDDVGKAETEWNGMSGDESGEDDGSEDG